MHVADVAAALVVVAADAVEAVVVVLVAAPVGAVAVDVATVPVAKAVEVVTDAAGVAAASRRRAKVRRTSSRTWSQSTASRKS